MGWPCESHVEGGDDSDEEARKRADKPKHRRKEDVHILPHKPTFGSMSTLRFQLNVLRYVLDFQSLQEEAIQEEELRQEERQREITEDGENCTELLTSGEVVTFDPYYYDSNLDDLDVFLGSLQDTSSTSPMIWVHLSSSLEILALQPNFVLSVGPHPGGTTGAHKGH